MAEYDVPQYDERVKVKDEGDQVKVKGPVRTTLGVARKEDHDEDLFDNIVVAGPHYREELSEKEQNAVEEAVKKHLNVTSLLKSDKAYKNMIGEWPPWNTEGEGYE